MAKKRKPSQKKQGSRQPVSTPNPAGTDAVSPPSRPNPLSGTHFGLTIAITIATFIYLILFLFTKTEFGDRFSTYLVLLFNSDIYWAFWTGSPGGEFHLMDRWPIALGLLFHLAISHGVGKLVLRRLCSFPLNHCEQTVLALGLGLAVISTYTVLVGLFFLLVWKQLLVIPILMAAVLGWLRPRTIDAGIVEQGSLMDNDRSGYRWMALAAIPFLILVVLASMIPPWEFDVREYHLQVPKEWFQQGGVSFLPHNVYGNMPLGTEMHAMFAMLYTFGNDDWWWGILIGKAVSGCFVILTSFGIYCIGKRLAGEFAGITGGLVYLTTPWTIANGIIGYNEGALSFYLIAALLIFLCTRAQLEAAENSPEFKEGKAVSIRRLSVLLGMSIGAAVGCKYTAIVFIALPFAIFYFVWLTKRVQIQESIRFLAWLVLGAFLMGGIWYVKNLMFTGNPTYPLLESVFQSTHTRLQIEQWSNAHSPDSIVPTMDRFLSILKTLVVSFKWLSPLAFPLFVLSYFGPRRKLAISLTIYLVFGFAVWLFCTHRLERFLLPLYSVVCILAGLGSSWMDHPVWRKIACTILLIGCGLNLLFASSRLVGDVRIFASMKQLDLRTLDAKDYSHPDDQIIPLNHLSPTIAWLNKNRPNSKVLFFGECRPLSAEFEVIYNTCFDRCETWKRLNGRTERDFLDQLVSEEITHVLVNITELNRFRSTYGYNVSDQGKPVVPDDLFKMTGTVFLHIAPEQVPPERDPGIVLLEVIKQ